MSAPAHSGEAEPKTPRFAGRDVLPLSHFITLGADQKPWLELLEKAVPMVHLAEDQALVDLSIADRQHLAELLNGVQRNCPGN